MPFYNSFKILTNEIHIKKLQLKTLPPPPLPPKKSSEDMHQLTYLMIYSCYLQFYADDQS